MQEAHRARGGRGWGGWTRLPQGGLEGAEEDVEDGAGGPRPVVEEGPQAFDPIAAAVMMDTSDFGWLAYFTWGGQAREFDLDYGAAPFGAGMEPWLEIVPSFNLERIRTPVLMWNAGSAISRWDWYSGLRRLGRPVEYWIIPDGEHDLFQVGQRLLVNQLTVDWFDFWLNGREDPDPGRSGQYGRWRLLREQQERVMLEPRPSLYDWSARPIREGSIPR